MNTTVRRDDSLLLAYDVAPTILELAGVDADASGSSENILPFTGRSFAGLLGASSEYAARGEQDVVGREHGGNAAIRLGTGNYCGIDDQGMYLGAESDEPGPGPMSGFPMPRERFDRGRPAGAPIGGGGPWRLHNLKSDPAERFDISSLNPEIVGELLAEWDRYVSGKWRAREIRSRVTATNPHDLINGIDNYP